MSRHCDKRQQERKKDKLETRVMMLEAATDSFASSLHALYEAIRDVTPELQPPVKERMEKLLSDYDREWLGMDIMGEEVIRDFIDDKR